MLQEEEKNEMSKSLIVSLLTILIMCGLLYALTSNIITMIINYINKSNQVFNTGTSNIKKSDDNHYLRDEYRYENQNDRILQSISNIHKNNNKQFSNLISYKKKYNLNDKLHSDITTKVLSSSNDNNEYKNPPNIFNFIMDVFKPSNK
jgi:predicted PurR-regulated permease PerM